MEWSGTTVGSHVGLTHCICSWAILHHPAPRVGFLELDKEALVWRVLPGVPQVHYLFSRGFTSVLRKCLQGPWKGPKLQSDAVNMFEFL